MKAGWEAKAVGDVCLIVGGGTPSRSNATFFDGDIPWATIRDMKANWIETTEFSITPAAVKSSATNVLPAGTVIVASRVGLGKVCRLRQDTAINQDLRGFIPKSGKQLDPQYLFLWFKSVADQIVAAGTGATVQGVTLPFLRSLQIPLPPLEEQRRIVAVLDEAFTAIATATANTEKNLANAQQLFDSFADSLFSSNTTEWKDGLLGGICDLFQGLAINKGSKHLIVSEGLPLLRIKDLRSGSHEMCVAPTGFPKNALVTPNDIIYTRTGQIGLVFRGRSGVIHNNCFKVVPSEAMDASFLFWWLQRPTFKKKIIELASRAAQPDITHSIFKSLPISVPPMSQQKDIVRRVEKFRGRTEHMKVSYIQKIALLDQIKQSVLRAAFGGTLGTIDAEALEAA